MRLSKLDLTSGTRAKGYWFETWEHHVRVAAIPLYLTNSSRNKFNAIEGLTSLIGGGSNI